MVALRTYDLVKNVTQDAYIFGIGRRESGLVHRQFELGVYIVIPTMHLQDWLAMATCKASVYQNQDSMLDALRSCYSTAVEQEWDRSISDSESEEKLGCGT